MGENVDLLWKIGASYVWSALANFCGRHKKFFLIIILELFYGQRNNKTGILIKKLKRKQINNIKVTKNSANTKKENLIKETKSYKYITCMICKGK